MGILINHISKFDDPFWEVLRWKETRRGKPRIHIRMVFKFYIEDATNYYRLDYDDETKQIIFAHKRPKMLLKKYNIDPNDDQAWLSELKELKELLFKKHHHKIIELLRNKPDLTSY